MEYEGSVIEGSELLVEHIDSFVDLIGDSLHDEQPEDVFLSEMESLRVFPRIVDKDTESKCELLNLQKGMKEFQKREQIHLLLIFT